MTRTTLIRSLWALLLVAPLSACGGSEAPAEPEVVEAAEYEKGSHNGRLLKDGDFALEMTIFEDGVPPQFRVYPMRDGKPIDAGLLTSGASFDDTVFFEMVERIARNTASVL